MANIEKDFGGLKTVWDKRASAESYDSIVRANPTHMELFDKMLDEMRVSTCQRIVDLGGGTGLFAMRLREKGEGRKVTIVDPAEEMLNLAASREIPNTELVHSGFENYSLMPIGRSDTMVVSSYVAHNFAPVIRKKLFEWLQINLKPGEVFLNGDIVADEAIKDSAGRLERADHFLRAVGAEHWALNSVANLTQRAKILAHVLRVDLSQSPSVQNCAALARRNRFSMEELWRAPESYLRLIRYRHL